MKIRMIIITAAVLALAGCGGSPGSATLSWRCAITNTVPWNSDLWQVGFRLTASNGSGQPADITNGASVTFTDQAGGATHTHPVFSAQIIPPRPSARFPDPEDIT